MFENPEKFRLYFKAHEGMAFYLPFVEVWNVHVNMYPNFA